MSLQMNDTSLGFTMKNAFIRIDSYAVNPAEPLITRGPTVYNPKPVLDEETGKQKFDEDGHPMTAMEVIEGEILTSEKAYSVNLNLQFLNEDREAVYFREMVSIGGLTEDQLNFKTFYELLKTLPKFENAKNTREKK